MRTTANQREMGVCWGGGLIRKHSSSLGGDEGSVCAGGYLEK